jgi:hypothetical protein
MELSAQRPIILARTGPDRFDHTEYRGDGILDG